MISNASFCSPWASRDWPPFFTTAFVPRLADGLCNSARRRVPIPPTSIYCDSSVTASISIMPPWDPKKLPLRTKRDMFRKPPADLVKCAKRGSSLALFLISNKIITVPEYLHEELIGAYCSVLQHFEPPDPCLLTDGLEGEVVQRARYCFVGLAGMDSVHDAPLEPIIAAWHGMFKWMVYLSELCRAEDPQHVMLMVIMNIVHKVCMRPEIRRWIAATPGILSLTTSIWMNEELVPEPPSSMITLNVIELLKSLPISAVGEVVSSAGRADVLVDRLISCLRAVVKKRASCIANIHWYLTLMQALGGPPESPARKAFLEPGVMRALTKTLVKVSGLDMKLDANIRTATIDLGFALVINFIETGTAVDRVRQCVHDGILEAIVNSAPDLDPSSIETMSAWTLIADIIPRYIVFRSVTEAVCASLAKLQDVKYQHKMAQSRHVRMKDAWDKLCIRANWQRNLKETIERDLSNLSAKCDACQKLGPKKLIRRCAGCHSSVYCSRKCQEIAWATTHRAQCAEDRHCRRTAATGVSKSDAWHHNALAVYHAKEVVPNLRATAARDYPDIPLYKFFVSLDYTVCPEAKYRLVELTPGLKDDEQCEIMRTITLLWVKTRLGEYTESTLLQIPSLWTQDELGAEKNGGVVKEDLFVVQRVERTPLKK
ncbi:hypothetical protein FA95DRAFT_676921 [Auriscalpium vulgare]|uniref:Uncharacterized protein n=1 Tax=Auriscalpium vulgare TaxID=40419 RepID=A0ACB8RBQ4_9AGAM|nr:hypothetical protein FA95DRAFT_676921 [Auriscalpium vulgare]